jgi:competence CoiA-like predicted nuclease
MFKCYDSLRRRDVIILDAEYRDSRLEDLRTRGKDRILQCPQCPQPVIVKVGNRKRSHFAHTATGACPALMDESPRENTKNAKTLIL